MVARFASGEPTPAHSHKRWGLEVGISSKERFTVWENAPSDPSRLTAFSDHHIEPEIWAIGTTPRATSTGSGRKVGNLRAS